MRLELAPFGIDVVIIEPGVIQTEFGDVMTGPMLERSGASAYAELARKIAKATRDFNADGNASPPSVIANVISKALKARRPRTRYVAGKLAKPMIAVRKWLGDRAFDKVIMGATLSPMNPAKTFAVGPGWAVLMTDLGSAPANVLRRAGLPGDHLSSRAQRHA